MVVWLREGAFASVRVEYTLVKHLQRLDGIISATQIRLHTQMHNAIRNESQKWVDNQCG